jgi:hypothetical protein
VKPRSSSAFFRATLNFSTSFFTELLKTQARRWNEMCFEPASFLAAEGPQPEHHEFKPNILIYCDLMLLGMGPLLLPAAFHQIVEQGRDTIRIKNLTTLALDVGLVPFAAGLMVNCYTWYRISIIFPGPFSGSISEACWR